MIKTLGGRKLSRTGEHRRVLLRHLAVSLFRGERIRTTYPKAKELVPFAEKILTLVDGAQENGSVSPERALYLRRKVLGLVQDREVSKKIFDILRIRYAARKSGRIRIIRLVNRRSDNAPMALVQLLP